MMEKNVHISQEDAWAGASQEQREIMECYQKLKDVLHPSTSSRDLGKIEKAFQQALSAHAGVRRKSGEPYIIHPLRVALIVAKEIGLGPISIVSAIMHDVVEDTEVSINEVRRLFGARVCRIVRGLTKIPKVFSWDRSLQIENFKKLLLHASEDNRIILVKLADRLDNMRYLASLPRRKQLKIAAETRQIYAPLAHRLGLNRIKDELEDLYLKYTQPGVYYSIAEKLAAKRSEWDKQLDSLSGSIKVELEKNGLTFEIQHRVKSIYSIWKKTEEKGTPLEKVDDLIALRIILHCAPEQESALCFLTYGIVSNLKSYSSVRFRDFINNPKLNGYESLHATLISQTGDVIELQIRTARMHEIAERGIAAHWGYKSDKPLGAGAVRTEKWLSEVRRLLEEDKSNTINLMEDLKPILYDDEISVLNKEGGYTVLPKGATVLDFTIETMDEKGLQCSGAMINKAFVPVTYVLNHMEQVEPILIEDQVVLHDWLQIAKTAKARRILKNFFRQEYITYLQAGKKILRGALKKVGLSLNKSIEGITKDAFHEKKIEEVYYKIGSQVIAKKTLEDFITDLVRMRNNNPNVLKSHPMPEIRLQAEQDVVVSGGDNPNYQLSSCCQPIPDEEIFGVLTRNKGIKIHRVDCPHAPEILSTQGPQVTKARWKSESQDSFLVWLELKAANKSGMSKDIVNTIKVSVHIESLSFMEEGGYIKGNLTIEVPNAQKLAEVMQMLRAVQGVIYVKRTSFA